MPFMDTELAALVARFPDKFLVGKPRGKVVLRAAMENTLPPDILHRKKVGFSHTRGPMVSRTLQRICPRGAARPDFRSAAFAMPQSSEGSSADTLRDAPTTKKSCGPLSIWNYSCRPSNRLTFVPSKVAIICTRSS